MGPGWQVYWGPKYCGSISLASLAGADRPHSFPLFGSTLKRWVYQLGPRYFNWFAFLVEWERAAQLPFFYFI